MRAKHIFLDWDGVVAPMYYELKNEPRDVNTLARLGIHSIDLPKPYGPGHQRRVDPNVVAHLNAFSVQEHVTIFWFSATGFLASDHFGPAVGLRPFERAPGAPSSPGQQGAPENGYYSLSWWKSALVINHAKTVDADVLFLDDSIHSDLQHHLRVQTGLGSKLSWLQPDSRLGLTKTNLNDVGLWVAGRKPFTSPFGKNILQSADV